MCILFFPSIFCFFIAYLVQTYVVVIVKKSKCLRNLSRSFIDGHKEQKLAEQHLKYPYPKSEWVYATTWISIKRKKGPTYAIRLWQVTNRNLCLPFWNTGVKVYKYVWVRLSCGSSTSVSKYEGMKWMLHSPPKRGLLKSFLKLKSRQCKSFSK